MKLPAALAVAACVLASSTLPGACASYSVRGSGNNNNNDDVEPPAVRKLDGEGDETKDATAANDGTPKIILDSENVDADWIINRYETGSCTCAHDAHMAIRKAVSAEFKTLPLVNGIFETIQIYLDRFLDYAVCAFRGIDCGCDDGVSNQGFKVINMYKVTTYQCCCDINAMRDVIINAVRKIASSWDMKMVGEGASTMLTADEQSVQKPFCFEVFERDLRTAIASVEKIGEIYDIPAVCGNFEETCPQPGRMGTIPAVPPADKTMPFPSVTAMNHLRDWFEDALSWAEYRGGGGPDGDGTFGPFPAGCKVSIAFLYAQSMNFPNEVIQIRVDAYDGPIVGVFDPKDTMGSLITEEVQLSVIPGDRHKIFLRASPNMMEMMNGNMELRSITLKLSSVGGI